MIRSNRLLLWSQISIKVFFKKWTILSLFFQEFMNAKYQQRLQEAIWSI